MKSLIHINYNEQQGNFKQKNLSFPHSFWVTNNFKKIIFFLFNNLKNKKISTLEIEKGRKNERWGLKSKKISTLGF